ncbi:unnamed protein product, partial [Prorocentrum cordatum]
RGPWRAARGAWRCRGCRRTCARSSCTGCPRPPGGPCTRRASRRPTWTSATRARPARRRSRPCCAACTPCGRSAPGRRCGSGWRSPLGRRRGPCRGCGGLPR